MRNRCSIATIIILLAAVLLMLFGCSSRDLPAYIENQMSYSSNSQDDGTPEYAVWICANSYMKMINGELDFDEGFNNLLKYANASIYTDFISNKDDYIGQIRETCEYMSGNDISLSAVKFSETIINDDGTATIYRILFYDNGDEYYFKQDLIKENEQWKIKSDTISNPFEFKKKFLFWYF